MILNFFVQRKMGIRKFLETNNKVILHGHESNTILSIQANL
jgi:hypothetical protein